MQYQNSIQFFLSLRKPLFTSTRSEVKKTRFKIFDCSSLERNISTIEVETPNQRNETLINNVDCKRTLVEINLGCN